MSVRMILICLACLIGAPAWSQGFAGLGEQADGFAVPARGRALDFPTDHGAHPEYRIEWWYVTANLRGADGRDYGIQWTLFRSALAPASTDGWDSPQIWMGHAAITTPEAHFVAERFARDGVGQAGAIADPYEVWIDDWAMVGADVSDVALRARGDEFSYDLRLSADGPLVAHGDAGYSVKSASGQASYYYSQPFYEVAGTLNLPDGPVAVRGQAWLDREWSSQPLDPGQRGWDWVSLHFDDDARMMGFQLRQEDGDAYTSGTWISPDGGAAPMADGSVILTPLAETTVAGREVPIKWRVEVPARGVDVEITALNPNAWMDTLFAYWEGPVRITGTHNGTGYLEMTGY
jgi:predicted secreted hydrolase